LAERVRLPRISPNLAATLVLVALAAGVLLWQRPWHQGDPAPAEPTGLPVDAAAVLTDQARALTSATSADAFATAMGASKASRTLASDIWQARELLGVDSVTWRYISGGDTPAYDNGDARARFDVGSGDHRLTLDLRVRLRAGQAAADPAFDIRGIESPKGALPLWLAGRLTLQRSDDVAVYRLDGGDQKLDVEELARTARAAVRRIVGGGIDGPLAVVSTPSQGVTADLLGQSASSISQIAAVATARDGRDGPGLPARVVVLNPAVFATMDHRAAQIVLTHEATHVLTDSIGSRGQTWVLEGFADFVALHDDTAALQVSAGQILAEVAASGPPKALPTSDTFSTAEHGLGAVYESAWLVFRMLGHDYGDPAVIAFYRDVIDGRSVEQAAQSAFGLSTKQLTRRWQAYLTGLADHLDRE